MKSLLFGFCLLFSQFGWATARLTCTPDLPTSFFHQVVLVETSDNKYFLTLSRATQQGVIIEQTAMAQRFDGKTSFGFFSSALSVTLELDYPMGDHPPRVWMGKDLQHKIVVRCE